MDCAVGTYSGRESASTCSKCEADRVAETEGSYRCIKCVEGKIAAFNSSKCVDETSPPQPVAATQAPVLSKIAIVVMRFRLPIARAVFTAEKESLFRWAVAATVKVPDENVTIVSIEEVSARRVASIDITTQIRVTAVTDDAALSSLQSSWDTNTLNTNLKSKGLPEATLASFSQPEKRPAPQTSGGQESGSVIGGVFGTATVCFLAVFFHLWRRRNLEGVRVTDSVDVEDQEQPMPPTGGVPEPFFAAAQARRRACIAIDSMSEVDLNRIELISDDQMKVPIQTWIRGSIFQNGRCTCSGTSVRNAVVTSVLKIQNGTLLRQYNLQKDIMKNQLAAHGSAVDKLVNKTKQPDDPRRFPELDQEINELFLFHGTHTGNTGRTIAQEGFDERVANLGGLYGAGSYFADYSCKSNQYTGRDTSRTFLICRVLMGWPFCTNTTHNDSARPTRRPPENTNGRPRYHSIFAQSGVANNGSQLHNEYIVFKGDQVYPDFLVTFTVS
jgi:hypothetical protein